MSEIEKLRKKIYSGLKIHDMILDFLFGATISFIILAIGFTLGYLSR